MDARAARSTELVRGRQADQLHAAPLGPGSLDSSVKDGSARMQRSALRGFALGRNSWLFAGSERGADRAALMNANHDDKAQQRRSAPALKATSAPIASASLRTTAIFRRAIAKSSLRLPCTEMQINDDSRRISRNSA